VQKKPKL